MAGQNENSTVKKAVFTADDFDWSIPYRPTLDITKHINIKGDFFADSEKEERTVTTFRMIADYETLVKSVYDGTLAYFNSFKNSGGKYSVAHDYCAEFVTYQDEPNVFTDAARVDASNAFALDKATKILEFSQGFQVFDEDYFDRVAQFEASLDAAQTDAWTQDVKNILAARGDAFPNKDYPLFPADFLAEFDEMSE